MKSHITSQTPSGDHTAQQGAFRPIGEQVPQRHAVATSSTPMATTMNVLLRRLLSICSHTGLAPPSGLGCVTITRTTPPSTRTQLKLTLGTSRSAPNSISNSSALANPPLIRLAGNTSRALLYRVAASLYACRA